MFKVNNQDMRMMPLASSVCIVNFEYVITGWVSFLNVVTNKIHAKF